MERMIETKPVRVPRTRRPDNWKGLTSARAGEIVPVAYFPLLREDSIRGRVLVQVRMEEALHTIINPIRVRARAYLVPKSALARFDGSMETLNRSYEGQTLPGGGAAPAWFVQDTSAPVVGSTDKGHAIYDKLGIHYKSPMKIHTDLTEAYWLMVNWRRRAVSKALPQENLAKVDALSPAFWADWKFDHIKPSFDAAMMEGEVPLNVDLSVPSASAMVYAKAGTGNAGTTPGLATNVALEMRALSAADGKQRLRTQDADGTQYDMFTSSAAVSLGGAATISLANIAMATKTAQFAKMRERYQGVPDEYLIDLLMKGIRVPPEDFREPILLGGADSVIAQVERYATDGASLDESVTRGMAQVSLPIVTPAINPGGYVLVTVEIVPEQLYERIGDLGLSFGDGTSGTLPDFVRDYLDPQKVEVVPNKYADSFHSVPDGIFGYAPLNHGWRRDTARIGGRYKRPVPDAFVEDRQRIWAVEKADPALSEDFYLCPAPFPHTVFRDADSDPFEIICVAQTVISGNTQFGAGFEEDDDHYEKIMAQVDTGRVESVSPSALTDATETETQEEVIEDETEE